MAVRKCRIGAAAGPARTGKANFHGAIIMARIDRPTDYGLGSLAIKPGTAVFLPT